VIDGQFHAADWWAIIFNPSFPYRLAHMMLASGLTAAFLIAGISAFQLMRNPQHESGLRMLRLGIVVAALLIPVQMFVGDQHGLNTLEHQPAKIAAMEGIWETERGAPLLLFAWPNQKERRNDYAIAVPGMASFILTHDIDGEVKGLSEFGDKHPPVAQVFWSFRIMVGVGVLMLLLSWAGLWVVVRRKRTPRWLLRTFAAMTFSGWIAVLAGWLTTEIGRQPWLVYGILTTAEAASDVPGSHIALTLVGYAITYSLLLVSYMVVVTQLAIKEAAGEKTPEPVNPAFTPGAA